MRAGETLYPAPDNFALISANASVYFGAAMLAEFSNMAMSGCWVQMRFTASRYSRDLGSSHISLLPADENPWHGGPAR